MTELLYCKKVHIIDPNKYAETELKLKDFYIQFSTKIEDSGKKDVFSKSSDNKLTVKASKDTLTVSTILPKFISIIHFKYLIAHILHVHVTALKINHENFLVAEAIDIYEKNAIINDYDFEITIEVVTKPRFNNYDRNVLSVIEKYKAFLNKFEIKNDKYRSQYVQVNYAMYQNKIQPVDIVRLFNINQTSKEAPKIYLHDEEINDFRNEGNNLMGTIKCKDPTLRPLQGLESSKNECGFLYNHAIENYPHIRLYNLVVLKNGIVIFIFKNIRFDDDKSVLSSILDKWMNKNALKYLEDIHLDECVYDNDFKVSSYKYIEMSHNVFVQLFTDDKLNNLNILNTLPAFNNVYTTKTSYRENGPQSMSLSTQLILNQCHNVSPTFQPTMMDFYFACVVQINQNEEGILIEIRNSDSDANTNLIMKTILGRVHIHDVAFLNDIISKLISLDSKIRIQQLKNADPVIFGSRNRDGLVKDYSQMVQNNDQRPSLLIEEEYKILKAEIPDSCINIENQTTHERLYLACPFDTYPIINFHAEKDQTCIVKCTSNFANTSQYNLCDEQLNGKDNEKTVENRYLSNTIVKFSTHILPGRRCFLPQELINIFPHCHLLKLTSDMPVQYTVAEKFRMISFIIERHSDFYDIITEYEKGLTYALIIKVYGTDDNYIMCEQETNTPYKFNDESKNSFVHQLIKISQSRKNNVAFVRFINSLLKKSYSDDTNMRSLIDKLLTDGAKFYTSFSDHRRIVAMMWKDKLYTIPEVFNLEFQVSSVIDAMKTLPNSLPPIDMFEFSNITKYYADFNDMVIVAIEYLDNVLLIQPIKIPKTSLLIEYVDVEPFYYNRFGFGSKKISKPLVHVELIDANAIITILINICLKKFGTVDSDKLKKVAAHRLSDKNQLVYVGNMVSWRKSKIDSRLLSLVKFNKESIMRLMYEFRLINSKYVYDSSREYLYRRLIY